MLFKQVLLPATLLAIASCDGGVGMEGAEGTPCYGNGTCNTGLSCDTAGLCQAGGLQLDEGIDNPPTGDTNDGDSAADNDDSDVVDPNDITTEAIVDCNGRQRDISDMPDCVAYMEMIAVTGDAAGQWSFQGVGIGVVPGAFWDPYFGYYGWHGWPGFIGLPGVSVGFFGGFDSAIGFLCQPNLTNSKCASELGQLPPSPPDLPHNPLR